jgi:hypothetical protein
MEPGRRVGGRPRRPQFAGRWRGVPGSGTGELAGIPGVGSFNAPDGPQVSHELDLDFD